MNAAVAYRSGKAGSTIATMRSTRASRVGAYVREISDRMNTRSWPTIRAMTRITKR